ncbi:Kae1-associated kinase Bud32 [Archaeoglobus sp.]
MLNYGKLERIYLGGEAEVRIYENVVEKIRKPKRYRHPKLDEILRKSRTKTEAKIISLARRQGVPTPIILDVEGDKIVMERIKGKPVKEVMNEEISEEIGRLVAKMHKIGIIHGDVTPMNMILGNGKVYFVDFGLAFIEDRIEPKGVDLHVFFESLKASFDNWEKLKEAFIRGYREVYEKAEEVIKRAEEIELRGRYVERRMT